MDYRKWLKDLEAFLRTRRPDINMGELDPNAMHQAFSSGMSPYVFGGQPTLPLRPSATVPSLGAPIQNYAPPPTMPQPGYPATQQYPQVGSQFTCPKCGFALPIGAKFCNQCGNTFKHPRTGDAGVYGILSIVAAGIGFFMCQVLVPFFILTSIIFGAFAYYKGARGQAIASFIMCAFLLAYFVYTMGQISAAFDKMPPAPR